MNEKPLRQPSGEHRFRDTPAQRLRRDAHVANLVEVMVQITGPVIIVAHSAGVMTTVQWAQWHDADVRGALLAPSV
ncbi:alpha/beta hydrolase [Streptomyces sp. NPDC097981]|uniref:alpha/beta hydrolase n=1 Tax=Streptomyces sp. NPDC097981 TaxID=3155428 RepID=UPI00331BD436